ncbi:MAG: 50S ribosomal protein L11 methyltransferase [Chloroflexi bacterium]|nr:50S ribosomal protein L11 methyltransferase [Chloroflexota bacterium]
MTRWVEVSVEADSEAAEELIGLLRQYCPDGIVASQKMEPAAEGADADWAGAIPSGPLTLRGYFVSNDSASTARRQIEESIYYLSRISPQSIAEPQFREITEEDWADAWKQHYHMQRIGDRLVIVPTWESYAGEPDDLIIRLDPGAAFGTGLHPTTRLALRLLEHAARPAKHLLDVGTGSGILAIAGALLGAQHVVAVDVHEVAVGVARANIAANNLTEQITVLVGSATDGLERSGQPFDVVIANIIARVLIDLADSLAKAVPIGGELILSGIIEAAEIEVLITFAVRGFEPIERYEEGEWRAHRLLRVR